jgi:hypothetical protein
MKFSNQSKVADPDPESGAFLTPGSGMGKKLGSGSGMNNPDQILRAYKNLSLLTPKIVLCGSGMENIRKNSDPG